MGSSIGFRKPKPVLAGCPSGLLRSEPAAGRFKAAMRRYAAALRALAERTRVPRQGSALLGRRSAPLVLRRPDPEAPGLRRFFSTAPEGQPAGAGSIPEGETERTPTMAKTASAPRTAARVVPLRKGTTLEMVRLACPDVSQATRISESFGLPVLDSDGIREAHHRLIVETADALEDAVLRGLLVFEDVAQVPHDGPVLAELGLDDRRHPGAEQLHLQQQQLVEA